MSDFELVIFRKDGVITEVIARNNKCELEIPVVAVKYKAKAIDPGYVTLKIGARKVTILEEED